jgi:hypothetical protein
MVEVCEGDDVSVGTMVNVDVEVADCSMSVGVNDDAIADENFMAGVVGATSLDGVTCKPSDLAQLPANIISSIKTFK